MKARLASLGLLAAVVLTWSPDADAAGEANGLGQRHQLIISADRLVPIFSYTSVSEDRSNNAAEITRTTSGSSISLLWGSNFFSEQNIHSIPRVAADVTVIERLTIGGAVAVAFGVSSTQSTETQPRGGGPTNTTEFDAPRATVFGLVPRVGYIIPVGDILAIWPRGGMGIYSFSRHFEVINNGQRFSSSTNDFLLSLDLDPQLAVVPLEHFFFSVGPLVNIPLTGSRTTQDTDNSRTSRDLSVFQLGITASLGGFFNL